MANDRRTGRPLSRGRPARCAQAVATTMVAWPVKARAGHFRSFRRRRARATHKSCGGLDWSAVWVGWFVVIAGAGKSPVPPAMMAMAVLLQAHARASDAEAVELTVVDLRWQLVLDRLGAEEPAFSQGALHDFRARLIRTDMDRRLLERTVRIRANAWGFRPEEAADGSARRDGLDAAGGCRPCRGHAELAWARGEEAG